jgi:hypothetical protein
MPPTPEKLYNLAYVRGSYVCPKCGFTWNKRTISVSDGEIGTTETDRQSDQCPNDGEWMEPLSYKAMLESTSKMAMQFMEGESAALQQLAQIRLTLARFRDSVLHQSGPLDNNGMDADQVNDVLNLFDDELGDYLPEAEAEEGEAS